MFKRLALPVLLALLPGCSKGFNSITTIISSGGGGQSQGRGSVDLLPATDKIDVNCMSSSDYDTCLFNKNPVYHSGRTFPGTAKTQIEPYQNLGVKLIGLTGSGNLESPDFSVQTLTSPRVLTSNNAQLKVQASQAAGTELEQLMTYYYFNAAFVYWSSRGNFAARQRGLKVIVDDRVTGFKKETNTIHLARIQGAWPVALDASQSLYLLGTANLHYASSGAIFTLPSTDSTHVSCGTDGKGCCASDNGCSRALISGLSTYFVAAMFPSGPVIGELGANRLRGFRTCNAVDRDLNSAASLTKTSSYSACAARQGDVHVMGTMYASIFWELRKRLVSEQADVDRLYLEHISQLRGTDTFVTAKNKLFALGSSVLTPSLRAEFTAEFQRRGL